MQNLRAIIADLSDERTFTEITVDVAEGYRWRIEMMYRDLLAKEIINGDLQGAEMEALGCLAQAYATMCQFIDSLMVHSYPAMLSQSSAQLLNTGGVGRPVFEIPRGQLQ